jgi:zinc protease
VKITQNKIVKGNTLTYESLYAKRDILSNLSKYGKSMTYIEEDQRELMGMTLGNFKEIIERYLPENEMFYVVVGDKKTQLKELNSLGKGAVIEMDINGNLIY